nr:hypothetical protein [uncultured Cohaesibacter sp.]
MTTPEHSKWDWRGMAESLAMINRYDGATHYPYSVAQHSCIGHDFAPQKSAFISSCTTCRRSSSVTRPNR